MESRLKANIQNLITKSDKKLKSAELLFANELYDDAVSRGYYAMFLLAKAALLLKGVEASRHSSVLSAFAEHCLKTKVFDKELGKDLRSALESREIGDYEFSISITHQKAADILAKARRFCQELKTHLEQNIRT